MNQDAAIAIIGALIALYQRAERELKNYREKPFVEQQLDQFGRIVTAAEPATLSDAIALATGTVEYWYNLGGITRAELAMIEFAIANRRTFHQLSSIQHIARSYPSAAARRARNLAAKALAA